MAVYYQSLPLVVLRIAVAWWIALTVIAVGLNPGDVLGYFSENIHELGAQLYLIAFVMVTATLAVGFAVYLKRELIRMVLQARSTLGIECSIGKVPLPTASLPRVSDHRRRVPLTGALIEKWMEAHTQPVPAKGAKGEESRVPDHYAKLLQAVWDTFCAQPHFPASHRAGGHGDRRLHVHCHDVAERALKLAADGWKYEGIFVKRRGRQRVQVFAPNSARSALNPLDPLIPIVALAHDIGKLQAYEVDSSGKITKNDEPDGNTLDDDDRGVLHDFLGPRILAMMPEYWELDARERAVINLSLAHYHHPSAFPLDRQGLIVDERAGMLMALLIDADRAVSAEEAGQSGASQKAELDEAESEDLYKAFVSILVEPGRINGVGDPQEDAQHRIGQKHGDFILLNEKRVRGLLQAALGLSQEEGDGKYRLTIKLLTLLKEKDLLYTTHNGVDLSAYLPMYRVGLYHSRTTTHIADVAPAILMKVPPVTVDELEVLSYLAEHPAKVLVRGVVLTHLSTVKDQAALDLLVERAFAGGGGEEPPPDESAELQETLGVNAGEGELPPSGNEPPPFAEEPPGWLEEPPDWHAEPSPPHDNRTDVQERAHTAAEPTMPAPLALTQGKKRKRLAELDPHMRERVQAVVGDALAAGRRRAARPLPAESTTPDGEDEMSLEQRRALFGDPD